MYFKSLEVTGFKSFAGPAVMGFEPDARATVRPNGYGQNDALDAIRWVLGGEKSGTLESSLIGNLIFGQASPPEPMGTAEISLTLGDARGLTDDVCQEVTVSRRLSRSGESQYFLNKQPCCLKDIHSLLVHNGLRSRGHCDTPKSTIQAIFPRAWLEVDVDKIAGNIRKLRRAAGPGARMLAMVKADGYGCGAEMVSRAALENGVEALGVSTILEALSLRRRGLRCPILVFGRPDETELEIVVKEDLLQSVFDLTLARQLDSAARISGKKVKVHINVDTGMGRLGVLPGEIDDFLEGFSACSNLVLDGVYTHFPVADRDRGFTEEQVKVFKEVVGRIRSRGYDVPLMHVANTAALLNRYCELFDMVRLGISIYGLYGSPHVNRELDLEEAVCFKARVSQVKRIREGASVSYGRQFIAPRETTIAIIAAGYADGLPFRLAAEGNVLIHGRRFPIVGRVTMDMTMIDVGDCTDVRVRDEAVIIGRSGEERISVAEVARKAGTIEHEITCGIGPRVPRVYLRNGGMACVQRYMLA